MKMTKQMEKAIRKLYRRAAELTYNDPTTFACVEISDHNTPSSFCCSFRVFTHRNDCEEFSPRQVLCRHEFHGWVTRYGKLVVVGDGSMTTDDHNVEAYHHARMMGCEFRNFDTNDPTHNVAVRYYQRIVRGNLSFDNR